MEETIEEAAERYQKNTYGIPLPQHTFFDGAKWQQERSYSEEDLRQAFLDGQENVEYSEMYGFDSKLTEQEWFEQFKKQ